MTQTQKIVHSLGNLSRCSDDFFFISQYLKFRWVVDDITTARRYEELSHSEEDPSKMWWNFNYFNVSSSCSWRVKFERNFSDISSSSKCFFNFHRRHHHLGTLTCDDDSRDTFPSQRWFRYSFSYEISDVFHRKERERKNCAEIWEKCVCVLVLVDDHAIGMLPNWFILNSTGLAVREKCFVFFFVALL